MHSMSKCESHIWRSMISISKFYRIAIKYISHWKKTVIRLLKLFTVDDHSCFHFLWENILGNMCCFKLRIKPSGLCFTLRRQTYHQIQECAFSEIPLCRILRFFYEQLGMYILLHLHSNKET